MFSLEISYPVAPGEALEEILAKDEKCDIIAGTACWASGFGFGFRDRSYQYNAAREADEARERFEKEFKGIDVQVMSLDYDGKNE